MILSKQKRCLLLTGVSTESQKRTPVLQTKLGFSSNKNYDSYKCWTCAEVCEALTFLMEMICAIWKHGISIVRIPIGKISKTKVDISLFQKAE